MIKIYFDNVLLDETTYSSLNNTHEICTGNFALGSTASNSYSIKVNSSSPIAIPEEVKIYENDVLLDTLIVDNYSYEDNIYTFYLKDKFIKMNQGYDASSLINNSSTGYVLLKDIVLNICSKYGITLGTTSFYGENKKISWYDNTISARDYIGFVAELNGGFARLKNNALYFIKQNEEVKQTLNKDDCSKFTLGDYHKISKVVYDLGTDAWAYGDNTNETLYVNKSNVFITERNDVQNIYNQVVGLEFYNLDTNNCPVSSEVLAGDIIEFVDGDSSYKIIANISKSYFGDWNGKYYLKVNSSEQETTQIIGDKDKIKNIQTTLNRESGRLDVISTEVDEQSEKITDLGIEVDNISAQIEQTTSVITEAHGVGVQTLNNLLQNKVIYLEIKPTDTDIISIFANNDIFASTELKSLSRSITFSGEEKIIYVLPTNLYQLNGTSDVFVQDNVKNECYVLHKIGIDENGDKYLLEEEEKEYFKLVFYTPNGNTQVYMSGYSDAYVTIKAMIKNDYTSQFATKVYVNNAVKITEEGITTKVNKEIEDINGEVSKVSGEVELKLDKDDTDTLISTFNVNSNQVKITSDNFNLDEHGNVECSNIVATGGYLELYSPDEASTKFVIKDKKDADVEWKQYASGIKWERSNGALMQFQNSLSLPNLIMKHSDGRRVAISPVNITLLDSEENSKITMTNSGNITCVSLTQTSKEESKKNFELYTNALEQVLKTDIYKYNLKDEEDGAKKHIGFVIGEKRNYSNDITSVDEENNETGVDTYSMISVLWEAVKEQQKQIEELKKHIKEMEEK